MSRSHREDARSSRAGGVVVLGVLGAAILTLPWSGAPSVSPSGTLAGSAPAREAIGQPDPAPGYRSPSGEWVATGSRERGHVLPLDVKGLRPVPRRRAWERPADLSPVPRGGGFEEHRLGADDGHTKNETSIAVDGGTVVAGWNNYTAGSLVMGVARSTDGGTTWTSDLIEGHDFLSDPVVRAVGGGRWYYGYLAQGGPGGSDVEIYVRRSDDDGATWSSPVPVTLDGDFDDKPYLDAAGDDVVVAYADFGFSPAKVRVASSTDGGGTYGNDTVLADASVGGNGACPVIAPDGRWLVFWRDSFQDSLWVSHSDDDGVTWSPDRGIVAMDPLPSSLPPGFRMVNLPSADADPVTGTLVVVWNDQRLGDADILSIRSVDGGMTWSDPVRVNEDASGESQFFPWIAFDDTGVGHVVWYDRRGNGFDIDVYVARTPDGGQSFEPNVRVTAEAFEPVLPWDTSVDFIGDYNGVAATAAFTYPCYQDARRGFQDVYVAKVPTDVVAVGAPGAAPPAPALVAAPNPFRTETVLTFARPLPGGASLDVVTVDGRHVRSLPVPSSGRVRWDGRDGAGRAVPPGVYLVAPEGGDPVRVVRVD